MCAQAYPTRNKSGVTAEIPENLEENVSRAEISVDLQENAPTAGTPANVDETPSDYSARPQTQQQQPLRLG